MPIITGDNHIAPYTWSRHPNLRGDSYFAFTQVVDLCIAAEEPMIILGDLFDAKKLDSRTVIEFQRQMDRMKSAELNVFAIQGQHDRTDPPWVSMHSQITHVDKKCISFHDTMFYFLDYRDPESLDEELKSVPENASVLCLHQALKQALPFENDDGSGVWDFEAEQVPVHIRKIFLGDIHTPYDFELEGRSFQYTGTTCMQAINEPTDKHVIWYRADGVELVPLQTRPFYSGTAVTTESLSKTCDIIRSIPDPAEENKDFPAEVARPYVVVVYQADVEGATDRLNAACDERDCERLLVSVRPELVSNGEIIATVDPDEVSLEKCLDLTVSRETEKELHTFLTLLLRTRDNEEVHNVLAAHRDEMGITL